MSCIHIKQNISAFSFSKKFYHFFKLCWTLPYILSFVVNLSFALFSYKTTFISGIWIIFHMYRSHLSDLLVWGPEWIWLFSLSTRILMIIRITKYQEGLFSWLNCQFNVSILIFTHFIFFWLFKLSHFSPFAAAMKNSNIVQEHICYNVICIFTLRIYSFMFFFLTSYWLFDRLVLPNDSSLRK